MKPTEDENLGSTKKSKRIIFKFCLTSERTTEEMERTKQFAKEVVDLLRHQPHYRMPFSKFIPTYHHHFGRQCKLSYYGFTKLIELFEAIPDVLMVSEKDVGLCIKYAVQLDLNYKDVSKDYSLHLYIN